MNKSQAERMEEIGYEMSNFDGSIDEGMAEALIAGEGRVHGRHAGWNFNSLVYYKDGKFHADVFRYRVYMETISEETLEELMDATNQKYGYA